MQQLREKMVRGTSDFPFATYRYFVQYPGYITVDLHWHPEIEILFIKKGEIATYVDEEKIILKEGDICFINPEELHTIATHSQTVEYQAAVFVPSLLGFPSGHFFAENFISPLTNCNIRFPRIISREHYLYEKILPMINLILSFGASKPKILANLTTLFCTFIDEDIMEPNPDNHHRRHHEDIKRCIEYMYEHYAQKITLTELADLVHTSPNYFCSFFKEYTGISAFAQLNHIRIKKATTLLSKDDDSIANIAKNCGFENMSYFIKKFKEIIGCTPSAYRKALLNSDSNSQ
ncbi:MAG: helix-turn-helix transcriptional regulator [Lachnospiraceae bacterium]|nr:helix-turn-helix transcriptional regulator [Lachnospiraceae bacterium]